MAGLQDSLICEKVLSLQCDYPCILMLLHTSDIYMCTMTVPSGYDVKSTNYFYLYTYAVLVLDTRLDVLYLKETKQSTLFPVRFQILLYIVSCKRVKVCSIK